MLKHSFSSNDKSVNHALSNEKDVLFDQTIM